MYDTNEIPGERTICLISCDALTSRFTSRNLLSVVSLNHCEYSFIHQMRYQGLIDMFLWNPSTTVNSDSLRNAEQSLKIKIYRTLEMSSLSPFPIYPMCSHFLSLSLSLTSWISLFFSHFSTVFWQEFKCLLQDYWTYHS